MKYIKLKKTKSDFISSILDDLKSGKNKSSLIAIHGIRQIKQIIKYLADNNIKAKAFMLNEEYYSKNEGKNLEQDLAAVINYLRSFSDKVYIITNSISRKISPEVKTYSAFLIIEKKHLFNFYNDDNTVDDFINWISIRKKNGLRLLYLEEIQDPGNLGTIIRSAEAFNFDGILLGKNSVYRFNDKVLSSSLSAVLSLPIYDCNDMDILDFKRCGFELLTFDMGGMDLEEYIKVNYDRKKDYILAFGNEGNGVSEYLLNNSDSIISINMTGKMESLNVAIASSISMYRFTY